MLGKIRSDMHDVKEDSLLGESTADLAKIMVAMGSVFSVAMLIILLHWEVLKFHEAGEEFMSKAGVNAFL